MKPGLALAVSALLLIAAPASADEYDDLLNSMETHADNANFYAEKAVDVFGDDEDAGCSYMYLSRDEIDAAEDDLQDLRQLIAGDDTLDDDERTDMLAAAQEVQDQIDETQSVVNDKIDTYC